ncbi:MAG TPA: hypothetical protein V6C91_19585 [Coleofasciculaceae cyanobacterium]
MPLLPILYLSVAIGYFANLLKALQNEAQLSSEQRQCAWRVMILAAALWPVVLPIAYLEKRSKAKHRHVQVFQHKTIQVLVSSENQTERDSQKPQETLQNLTT